MPRQTHRAGEKVFVDYAGQTIPVIDPVTGNTVPAHLFVAVLGASNSTYAEATLSQDLFSWISAAEGLAPKGRLVSKNYQHHYFWKLVALLSD